MSESLKKQIVQRIGRNLTDIMILHSNPHAHDGCQHVFVFKFLYDQTTRDQILIAPIRVDWKCQ